MMAKEAMRITDVLPNPKIFIRYDDWFSDKNYRQAISRQLGLEFSDRGLNNVMKVGSSGRKGSSFDRMAFADHAQNMDVLNRWKKFVNNKVEFTDVLKMNPEMMEMSKKLFGEYPF